MKKPRKSLSSSAATPPSAVEISRQLHELQVHQNEMKMQHEELADLYDFAPVGYFTLDPDGVILQANLTGSTLLEVDRELLLKRRFGLFLSEQTQCAFTSFLQRVFTSKVNEHCDAELLRPANIHIEGRLSPDGRECRAVVVEITERKASEAALRESEELLRLALDAATTGIFDWLIPENRITWSRWHEEMFGYKPGEFDGTYEGFSKRVHSDDLPGVNAAVAQCIETRSRFRREFRVIWPDASEHWVVGHGEFEFSSDGKAVRMRGVVKEVTDRKSSEHVLRDSELQQRELARKLAAERARLVEAQAVAQVGSWESDLKTSKADWSDQMHRIFETDPAVFHPTHQGIVERIHQEDRPRVGAAFTASMSHELPCEIEHRIVMPDGRVKIVEERWRTYHDDQGEPLRAVGTCWDITKRKLAEDVLRRSETLQANGQRIAHFGSWELDLRTQKLTWSDEIFRIFGLQPQEFEATFDAFFTRVHPEDQTLMLRSQDAALAGQAPLDFVHRIVRADGQVRWVHELGALIRDNDGKPIRLEGTVQDITSRRQTEMQLEQSEARAQAIMDNSPAMIFLKDLDGRYLHVNRRFESEFSLSRAAVLGRTDLEIFPREQAVAFRANDVAVLDAGVTLQFEEIAHYADGEHVSIVSKFPLFDAAGKVRSLCGIAIDITTRKRAEEEQSRLLHILEESLNEIYIFDGTNLRFEFVNRAAQKNLGYTMQQLAEMTPVDLKPDYTFARFCGLIAPLESGEKLLKVFETVHRRVDGSHYPVEVHLQRVNHRSRPVFLGMVLDITQRKETERALKFEQNFNRILLETFARGVVACDASGRLTLFNRTAREWHGMDALKLPQNQWSKYYNLCEVDGVTPLATDRIPLVRALGGESVRDAAMSIVAVGQSVRFISCQASPLLDANGDNIGAVAIMRDITEDLKAEEELRVIALQLMHAEDAERRRIAKELHDSTAQDLVAAMMNLSVVQASLNPSDAALAKRVDDTLAGLEKCTHDLRTLAYVLHPPRLEEAGLGEAIRHYTTGFGERRGITTSVEVEADFGRLEEGEELVLFRVIQESLGNIHRHSGSPTACIRLTRHAGDVVLEISDSGRGLPAAILGAWPGFAPGLGVGLAGMRERLRQIGGRLELESGSSGTTVRAILPCKE